MSKKLKVIVTIALMPIFIIAAYISFLWATYIDDTITTGNKYGFTIGASKQQTYESIAAIKEKHPELVIYISYGPHAGDNMTFHPTNANFTGAQKHNQWKLLLDGDGEFFNIIRLNHENNTLTQIYRHRKYFELP